MTRINLKIFLEDSDSKDTGNFSNKVKILSHKIETQVNGGSISIPPDSDSVKIRNALEKKKDTYENIDEEMKYKGINVGLNLDQSSDMQTFTADEIEQIDKILNKQDNSQPAFTDHTYAKPTTYIFTPKVDNKTNNTIGFNHL